MPPYRYTRPPGWRVQPQADRDAAIGLREPTGTPRAGILLLRPLPRARSLADELAAQVPGWCADGEVLERSEAIAYAPSTLPALVVAVRLRITRGFKVHEERRLFVLVDAGPGYLPVVFLGGPDALPAHHKAFAALVASLGVNADFPFPID